MKDLASLETCCWYTLTRVLVTVDDGGREAWHISTSAFFKGGKPEVSAGGEDAFKARTAIHKRSHWRWKLRIRYRHTSIRKSAKRSQHSVQNAVGDVGTFPENIPSLLEMGRRNSVATRTMIFSSVFSVFSTSLKDARFLYFSVERNWSLPVYYPLFSPHRWIDDCGNFDFVTFTLNFC